MNLNKRHLQAIDQRIDETRAAAARLIQHGVRYPGETQGGPEWLDAYVPFPTRAGPEEMITQGLFGSMIHTRVSNLGMLTNILLMNMRFIRLQMTGAGLIPAEQVVWDHLVSATLKSWGYFPVRRDYVCSCEDPDVYPSMEILLGQGCELSYSTYHFEFDGELHGESSKKMLEYLSALLFGTKLAACLAVSHWTLPGTDSFDASAEELEDVLAYAKVQTKLGEDAGYVDYLFA